MDTLYNILWLDDEDITTIPILEDTYPVRITKVTYIEECEQQLLNHSEDYHAVILDANGLYSKDLGKKGASKAGLANLITYALDMKLPTYIFSGNIDRGHDAPADVEVIWDFFKLKGLVEGESIFYKGEDGSTELFDKLVENLNKGYQVFDNYPEVKELVLHYGVDKETMKQLLSWIDDPGTNPFPDLVALRRILVDDIRDHWMKSMFGLYASENIQRNCIKETCMHEAEYEAFQFSYNLLNKNIHNWPKDSEFMKNAIASSFMISLNWFCRFRKQYEKAPNPSLYYKGAHVNVKEEKLPGTQTSANPTQNLESTNKAPVMDTPDTGVVTQDGDGFFSVNGILLKNETGQKFLGEEVRIKRQGYSHYKKIAYEVKPTSTHVFQPATNLPFAGLEQALNKKKED